MISPSDLIAAGWAQDTRKGVTDFWDKGILSYEAATGDVIYTKVEPYVVVAESVKDTVTLEGLSTWKPPQTRTSPRKAARGSEGVTA